MTTYTVLEKKVDLILEWLSGGDTREIREKAKEMLKANWRESVVVNSGEFIREHVMDFLKSLGAPVHNYRIGYLSEAIAMAIEDPKSLHSITVYMYPEIANRLGTDSWTAVERNIHYSIGRIFEIGDPDLLDDIFGRHISGKTGKVAPKAFISLCALEVKNRMKEEGLV